MNLIDAVDRQLLKLHPDGEVNLKSYLDNLSNVDEGYWETITTTLKNKGRQTEPVSMTIEIVDNGKVLRVELKFNQMTPHREHKWHHPHDQYAQLAGGGMSFADIEKSMKVSHPDFDLEEYIMTGKR